MTEKNIEELLDELIAEASEPVIKALTEEDLKHLDDAYPYEISKEHEEKMKEIFKQAGYVKSEGTEDEKVSSKEDIEKTTSEKAEDEKNKVEELEFANLNKYKSTNRRKARKIFLVAAILVAVLAIGCVGAFRDSFVKYYLEIKKECSKVKNKGTPYKYGIENVYFGYMPSEYELVDKRVSDNSIKLYFMNTASKDELVLNISNIDYTRDINTETAIIEELVINGKDMIYCERENTKILTWRENGKIFVLSTNNSKELLLKVSENMRLLNEMSH